MIPINNSLKIENLLIEDIYYKEPDLSIWVSECTYVHSKKRILNSEDFLIIKINIIDNKYDEMSIIKPKSKSHFKIRSLKSKVGGKGLEQGLIL